MLTIRRIPGRLIAAGWTDASLQNRPDSMSTGGYLVGVSGHRLLDGDLEVVTPVSWRAHKLRRVGVSSLSVETKALRTMEDELHMVRLCLAEMQGQIIDLHVADEHVASIPGIAVIDAKAI